MDDSFFARTSQFPGILYRKLRKLTKTVIEFRAAEIRVKEPRDSQLSVLCGRWWYESACHAQFLSSPRNRGWHA